MFGFLIALGAGFAIPHLKQPVVGPIMAQLRKFITVDEAETAAIAVMVATFGAAVVASVFDTGSAIGISIGVFIGYFATRILAVANRKGT